MKRAKQLLVCAPILILCALLAPGRLSAASEQTSSASSNAQLRVVVCNRVGLAASALNAALREVTRILRYAGVTLTLGGSFEGGPSNAQTPANCDTAPASNIESPSFMLEIRGESPAALSGDTLGIALRGALPRVVVFADRLRDFVRMYRSRSQGDLGVVMGNVIAHELGHLLLPSRPHTAFGIMSTGWGAQHAADAAAGVLRFHDDQARAIRDGVLQQSNLTGN